MSRVREIWTVALIELEWRGDVAIVRLNDPSTLNAVSLAMMQELSEALDQIEGRARAMVLTGTGKGFCSGANLAGGGLDGIGTPEYDAGSGLEQPINPLVQRLTNLSVPWISAVNGAAAGIGASFALMADMIIATDKAYFMQAFAKVGLVPDGGSSHLLVRTIGRVRAMEMMLLAGKLPAQKALEWGLINRVVAEDALMDEALALADQLAEGAASLREIRKLAWQAVNGTFAESLQAEREAQFRAGQTKDHIEGVTAFVQKRPAQFTGA